MLVLVNHGQSRINPRLLTFLIIPDVRISHGRQFTGGVLGRVSSGAGAVDHDIGRFVRQQARGKLLQ